MTGTCRLCDRERHDITEHHVIPRTTHSNKQIKAAYTKAQRKHTEPVCKPCHKQIHVLITEKDMAWQYYTIELLKAHPEVAKWIIWVKDRTF